MKTLAKITGFFKRLSANQIIGVTIILTLIHLVMYVAFELRGNFQYLPLTSQHFGIPKDLADKGLKPHYIGDYGYGWDGQFYYFMANDPLDRKNTSQHLDSPAYRYQRIGLSILPYTFAKVLGMSWVSPEFFLLCYMIIFILGLFILKEILAHFKISPLWIAAWGLFASTQITIINYLPDAAGDIFLFLSVYFFLIKRKPIAYAIAASFSSLSREIYILFFAGIFFLELFSFLKEKNRNRFLDLAYFSIPGIIFLGWQLWCRIHFNVSPSSLAYGVIGTPIFDWIHYLLTAHTLIVGLAMLCFFVLLCYQLKLLFLLVKKEFSLLPVLTPFMCIILLYLSFGKTVLEDWTGFMKPAALFLVSIPISISALRIPFSKGLRYVLTLFLITSFILLYSDRLVSTVSRSALIAGFARSTTEIDPSIPIKIECQSEISFNNVAISLLGETPFYENELLRKLFLRNRLFKLRLSAINNSEKTIPIAQGDGDTRLRYFWENKDDKSITHGGAKAMVATALLPGKDSEFTLVVQAPRNPGKYALNLYLAQEGCNSKEKDIHSIWQKDYDFEGM